MTKVLGVLVFLLSVTLSNAQIDRSNNSFAIPAEEVKDPKADNSLNIKPEIEKDDSKSDEETTITKVYKRKDKLETKKPQSISMVQKDNYKNPAELHTKTLDKQLEFQKEQRDLYKISRTPLNFGKIRTRDKIVKLYVRDHRAADGDLIRIIHNKDIVYPSITLTNSAFEITLMLDEGENEILFFAINEGVSSPNTAEFVVTSLEGELLMRNEWALITGNHAKIIIITEKQKITNIISKTKTN